MTRRDDLTTPRQRRLLSVHYDHDAFGQFSESVARFIGTARFLVYQTGFCIVWVLWNFLGPQALRFDEWQFIGLTLLLSLQAAYAAPLILLAQNRQEQRDRTQSELDRRVAAPRPTPSSSLVNWRASGCRWPTWPRAARWVTSSTGSPWRSSGWPSGSTNSRSTARPTIVGTSVSPLTWTADLDPVTRIACAGITRRAWWSGR